MLNAFAGSCVAIELYTYALNSCWDGGWAASNSDFQPKALQWPLAKSPETNIL